MATHSPTGKALIENGCLLDTLIDNLLGQGLSYGDWRRELESRGGLTWTETLKNTVIKKEFIFFRDEILRLQSEPNTARGLKSKKTNSLESILKRLQGLEWVEGVPNEMEQRKRDGRLLGKDAKARCLQYHVSRWKAESTSTSFSAPTSTMSSEPPKASLNTKDPGAVSQNFTLGMMSSTPENSKTTNAPLAHASNSGQLPNDDPCNFQKPLAIFNLGTSPLFGYTTVLPDLDSTLAGDCEIPWVPPTPSPISDYHGGEITFEDFFDFVEENPNFPIEPPSNLPSFELPRGNGINDSYDTYFFQASRDLSTQKSIIEGIFDHYGSQPTNDTWLTRLNQENNDRFSPSIETESFAIDDASSSNISHQEYQEAEMRPSRDQNESITLAPGIEQYTVRTVDTQSNTLHHIGAELRKKRDELTAAENTVSKLWVEIELLEKAFAKRGSEQLEDTSTPQNRHKRGSDEILHGAKRLKERAAARSLGSGISAGGSTDIQSPSMQTPCSQTLVKSTNIHSNDAGYGLGARLFNCRDSSMDDLEEVIPWVS